ncbi:MAG: hypothetical protein MRZ79_21760 [Bacteroidia bacterium]|nr:hypothetical protein [Bacteroidia bacterium]
MKNTIETNSKNISRLIGGTGIVCGLEITIKSDCSLLISEGYGLTSSGRILYFPGKHYRYYTAYSKAVKGLLSPSQDEGELDVYQLMVERPYGEEGVYPLTPQNLNDDPFFQNKVMLLYMEKLESNGRAAENNPQKDDLEGESGLEELPQEEFQIQALMVEREVYWEYLQEQLNERGEILTQTPFESEDVELYSLRNKIDVTGQYLFQQNNRNTSLRSIEIMRFGHGSDDPECRPENKTFTLAGNDFEAYLKEYSIIIDDLLLKLIEGVKILHKKLPEQYRDNKLDPYLFFDLFPKKQRDYLDKYLTYLLDIRWQEFKKSNLKKLHVQYFSDLVRELAYTYNEIVDEVGNLINDCDPVERVNHYPFHLLLGEVQEEVNFGPSIFRHEFRQPGIYNQNADRLQNIRFLHWRMVMMIKCFYLPGRENPDYANDDVTQILQSDMEDGFGDPKILLKYTSLSKIEEDRDFPIRIVPGQHFSYPVDGSVIPFYYYTAMDSNSIHNFWNYDRVKRARQQYYHSYYAQNRDGENYTTLCSIKRPFSYDIRSSQYYRIEGHMGRTDVVKVVKEIKRIRDIYNLNFHVLVVELDDQDTNNTDKEFLKRYIDEEGETMYGISEGYEGATHIGGVEKGGVFIILTARLDFGEGEEEYIIGDFSMANIFPINRLGQPSLPTGRSMAASVNPVQEEEVTKEESTASETDQDKKKQV